MDDRTYRRLFCETPRQVKIRHNYPLLNHLMTKAEREHDAQLCKESADGQAKTKKGNT